MAAHAHHTPPSPAVQRQIAANRKRILTLEAAIAALILTAYQQAQRQIAPAQAALLAAYERELARRDAQQRQTAEADGASDDELDDLPPARVPSVWLSTSHEAHHYRQTALLALSTFALASRLHISDGQAQSADAGATETHTLLTHLFEGAAVAVASRGALDDLVGMSATTGKPLATLLDGMGAASVARLDRTLAAGLTTGATPAALSGALDDVTGMAYRRAIVVNRTELMGAYRAASGATMQANAQTVNGWYWSASPDACPFCTSMNDTFHTLDETLDSHPNCRCIAIPSVRSPSTTADDSSADSSPDEEV